MTPELQQDATVGQRCVPMGQILERGAWLCRTIAGADLLGVPLYLVPQSRIAAEFGNADGCYGYTLPSAALYLRSYIDPWLGFGPCAVINDLALAEDFDPIDLEYATLAVILHELAHILDRPVLCDDRRDAPLEKIQFESLVLADSIQKAPRSELPPYAGHGPSFMRLVIHLAHRANLVGVETCPAAVFAGHRYSLSPTAFYQDALEDEPTQQINRRLRDLPSVAPPNRFLDVWDSDVHRYERLASKVNGAGNECDIVL
ncbi:MAG: hypothetical protein ABL921_11330 [Pirellula sp.]